MSGLVPIDERLDELQMAVTVIAAVDDKIVEFDAHFKRLHEVLSGRRLAVVPGAGHTVHYVAQLQIAEAMSTQAAKVPFAPRAATRTEPASTAE